MKTKEKAPILEQIITKLEKERKKEIQFKKIELIAYVLLLLVWSWYFGSLLYLSCKIREGELNLWIQSPFQIALFLSALAFFGSYIRNRIAMVKREKLLTAIKQLKRYFQEDTLPVVEIISKEEFVSIKIYPEEGIKISRIIQILPKKSDDLLLFSESLHKEISPLSEEQKEKYLKKLNELEDFFTYL